MNTAILTTRAIISGRNIFWRVHTASLSDIIVVGLRGSGRSFISLEKKKFEAKNEDMKVVQWKLVTGPNEIIEKLRE